MKTFLAIGLIGCALPPLCSGAAAKSIRIRTKICVVSAGGSRLSFVGGVLQPEKGSAWISAAAPTELEIGDEKVEIGADGSLRTENSVGARSRIEIQSEPILITRPGLPAEVVIGQSVDYFEAETDQSFRLRHIPASAAGAPHCDVSVTPQALGTAGPDGYKLDCAIRLALVASRDAIPGVALDVGKPRLAEFTNRLLLGLQQGKWYCLVLLNPKSAYTIAILLQVTTGQHA